MSKLVSGTTSTVTSLPIKSKELCDIINAGSSSGLLELSLNYAGVSLLLKYNEVKSSLTIPSVIDYSLVGGEGDSMQNMDEQAARGLEMAQQMIDDPLAFETSIADGFNNKTEG